MDESRKAALRAEVFAILERQNEERRLLAEARLRLRRRGMCLRKRGNIFVVHDHLGGLFHGTFAQLSTWIDETEAAHG